MDYSKMSDFEINAAVFESLHGGAPDYKEGDCGAMVLISYEGDVVGGDAVEVEVEHGLFNPCNNPSDAWPIILDAKIQTFWRGETWGARTIHTPVVECQNPLRAAMIVFLLMQELPNVPANSTGSDLR
jgi:hypothetical protein|nr:MAG TPA: Protein of unknown function (DUF2591) [Caudoviricetes sp.]